MTLPRPFDKLRKRRGGSRSGRLKVRGRAVAAARPAAPARARSAGDITTAMPKRRRRGSAVVGFGLGLRGGGRATTRPRADAMISRRAAASAGRSSRRMASQRWRGRVGRLPDPSPGSASGSASTFARWASADTLPRRAEPSSPARGEERQPSPAMATRPARMRFSASRLLDIAAVPSIAASFQGGGIIARDGRTWIKEIIPGVR